MTPSTTTSNISTRDDRCCEQSRARFSTNEGTYNKITHWRLPVSVPLFRRSLISCMTVQIKLSACNVYSIFSPRTQQLGTLPTPISSPKRAYLYDSRHFLRNVMPNFCHGDNWKSSFNGGVHLSSQRSLYSKCSISVPSIAAILLSNQ